MRHCAGWKNQRRPATRYPSSSTTIPVAKTPIAWKPNKIDTVELIAITQEKVAIIARQSVQKQDGPLISMAFEVPAGGVVLRARGRRIVSDGPDLMFYTNPVRIVERKEVVQP